MAGIENAINKEDLPPESGARTKLLDDSISHRFLSEKDQQAGTGTPADGSTPPGGGTPTGARGNPYGDVAPGAVAAAGGTPKPPTDTPPPPGPDVPAPPKEPAAAAGASTEPKWQPKNPPPGWDTPGPAQPGPGSNGGSDPHRTDIDEGLKRQIGVPGQMIMGGASGVLFGGPISWGLNRAVDSLMTRREIPNTPLISGERGTLGSYLPQEAREGINQVGENLNSLRGRLNVDPESRVGRVATWWQDRFDPRYFNREEIQKQETVIAEKSGAIGALIDRTEQRIDHLSATDLGARRRQDPGELALQQERRDILRDPAWITDSKNRLDTFNSRVLEKPELFTAEEQALLRGRQQAQTTLEELRSNVVNEQSFEGKSGGNFIKGAAMVGLTIAADNYIDRLFNRTNHKDGLLDSSMTESLPLVGPMTKSWHTNALLVPLAMNAETWSGKIGYTVAALAGGAVLDKMMPAGEHEGYSKLMIPTGAESIAMGGAMCLPVANNWVRAGLIAGAWGLGRIASSLEKPAKLEIKNESYSKLDDDLKNRTADSMNSAIDSFKKLGNADDQALKILMNDWLRPGRQYDSPLSGYRGAVILTTAFGESRLDHGTLLPNSKTEFMLHGKDLDIGAEATRALLIAQINVDRAKQQTQNEIGQKEKDKTVTDQEIKDLDKIKARIDSDLQNRIYGKHDIAGAVDELGHRFRNDPYNYKIKMSLDEAIDANLNSANKGFLAKLYRDEACIFLSIAKYKFADGQTPEAQAALYGTTDGRQAPTRTGQVRGYDGAEDVIKRAKQIDPNNPDIEQLEKIANDLKQKIPQPGK